METWKSKTYFRKRQTHSFTLSKMLHRCFMKSPGIDLDFGIFISLYHKEGGISFHLTTKDNIPSGEMYQEQHINDRNVEKLPQISFKSFQERRETMMEQPMETLPKSCSSFYNAVVVSRMSWWNKISLCRNYLDLLTPSFTSCLVQQLGSAHCHHMAFSSKP